MNKFLDEVVPNILLAAIILSLALVVVVFTAAFIPPTIMYIFDLWEQCVYDPTC